MRDKRRSTFVLTLIAAIAAIALIWLLPRLIGAFETYPPEITVATALGERAIRIPEDIPDSVDAPMTKLSEGCAMKSDGTVIDTSGADYGYIAVRKDIFSPANRVAVMRKGRYEGDLLLGYNIAKDGSYTVIPLSDGPGEYVASVYKRSSLLFPSQHEKLFDISFIADIPDEATPFLQPNVCVPFSGESIYVRLARVICEGAESDAEKAGLLYKFVTSYLEYDWDKYGEISQLLITDTMPDLDKVMRARRGVCHDYASLYAAMCRSVGIPVKVVLGKAPDGGRHAWNYTLIGGAWLMSDPTNNIGVGSGDVGYSALMTC